MTSNQNLFKNLNILAFETQMDIREQIMKSKFKTIQNFVIELFSQQFSKEKNDSKSNSNLDSDTESESDFEGKTIT